MVSAADRATGPDRGRLGGLRSTGECPSQHESTSVIACPECGLPAEVIERFSLSSTDGPVEHVALACVDGHYFRMSADMLSPGAGPPLRVSFGANSRVGFSRLPGALGTAGNAESATKNF